MGKLKRITRTVQLFIYASVSSRLPCDPGPQTPGCTVLRTVGVFFFVMVAGERLNDVRSPKMCQVLTN